MYEGMSVQMNSDGYRFLVSPLGDGFPPQGFKLDSQLTITGYHPEMGLREVRGTDPANKDEDYFALGQGTPQYYYIWRPQWGNFNLYAAGTAFIELRYSKDAT